MQNVGNVATYDDIVESFTVLSVDRKELIASS